MKAPLLISLFPSNLGESVARLLHTNLHTAKYQKFSDSEVSVILTDPDQYSGQDIHIFQTSLVPMNDTVFGIAFLAQQLKQVGAKKITLVCPYLAYSRQDKSLVAKEMGGSVEIIARLFEASGIDTLITVELHNPDIKKCFTIPVHELSLDSIITEHIKWRFASRKDLCLVAPDKGGYDRVAKIALQVGAGVLVFSKERYGADKTRLLGVSGTCAGKTAILIDDIIDTAGTAINVARALVEILNDNQGNQSNDIIGYFVHPVLSGDAGERIEASPFTQVFVSNTIPLHGEHRKIETFDISGVLAEYIWKVG